jgi:hypothetical protein
MATGGTENSDAAYLDVEEEDLHHDFDSNIERILTSVVELQKELATVKSYVTAEVADIKKILEHLSACTDCIVLSIGTPAKDAHTLESRFDAAAHLLLPAHKVFDNDYIAGGVCSGLPHFVAQKFQNLVLSLDSDFPVEVLRGIMFSMLPTDKKSARPTLPRGLHSELKLFIVRMLLRNSKCRAHTLEPPNPVAATELESPAGSGSRSETTGSALSRKSLKIEVDWMKSGYVREEILQEVRRELDGGDTGEVEVRPKKKRKVSNAKERRDDVSRYLLKIIYPKIHSFFRNGRDSARKQFFKDIGFILRPAADASVMVHAWEGGTESVNEISKVALTYPRVFNMQQPQDPKDDEENQLLYEKLMRSETHLKANVQYSVHVSNLGSRRVNKDVDLLTCALNICVTLLHLSHSQFWRVSVHSLRLVYVVALAIRKLLVHYEERQERQAVGGVNIQGEKLKELEQIWAPFVCGENVSDKKEKEGVLLMTRSEYDELCQRNNSNLNEVASEDGGQEDESIDDTLEGAEFRMP